MNQLPHPELKSLLAAHALGALDGEELEQVEAHLATACDECEIELAQWLARTESIAESVPLVEPSEGSKAKLLEQLDASATEEPAVSAEEPSLFSEEATVFEERSVESTGRRFAWAYPLVAAAMIAASRQLVYLSTRQSW